MKRKKEPQEQLKHLTKMFHHLRTSAAIECKYEDDGSADYWVDFSHKVSEYFRINDVDEWGKCQHSHHLPRSSQLLIFAVRQLYEQDETAQSNNIAMFSNGSLSSGVDVSLPANQPSENGNWIPEYESSIVDGEPLRDEPVGMVGRKDVVEVERINGQALEAEPPCHTNLLQNELFRAKYNRKVRVMSATSGSTVRSKQAKPVERDLLIDNVDTDDTTQSKPAENQGVVDDPVKGVATWSVPFKSELSGSVVGRRAIEDELVEIEHGVSGVILDRVAEGNFCESEDGVCITTKGGAIEDERVQDESNQDKPNNDRLTEHNPVEDELMEGASVTDNGSENDIVEEKPASDTHDMNDTDDTDQSTSFGSERIVSAATGVSKVFKAKTPTDEGEYSGNGIALVDLTDARSPGGRPFDVEPAETSARCDTMKHRRLRSGVPLEKPMDSNAGSDKIDPVGSAKTLTMDNFEIQSGPVGQSSVKKYGIPSGTTEGSVHGSVVNGICAQSQLTAPASWESKLMNKPTELNSNRGSAELIPIEEPVNCKALQLKSSSSNAQDKRYLQLELAYQGMAEREPALMKPVGSDQPEKLRILGDTLPSVSEADSMTDHLATKQLAMSPEETSPRSPKQDNMSVGGLEAGNSAGLDLHLSSRMRPLEVFRWPGDEQRGPYVVLMIEMQLGVGAAVIAVLGMLLYFAYRWWL
jgi:hypothetical protein